MIDNTSVVIEFVKSFAIITRKEAGDGPYLKKPRKQVHFIHYHSLNKAKKDEVLLPQVVKKLALRKPFIAT